MLLVFLVWTYLFCRMFKSLISSVLLGLLLFSLFYNTVIWTRYELNIEEITELFCVNKDKPELQCFGKCSVSKELIDFNLLPETQELPVKTASYVPALKHFVVKRQPELNFEQKSIADDIPARFCYCFWESYYPDPLFTPPRLVA